MLSVGFDHRALDGAAASAFLLDVIDRLEGWGRSP
jgi:pyruvate/2-oxoglutarate dehydrogenase complex dihydrolipoamide acyltransferase (E2) component